jgi:type IV fimbrial biogenesis protein FimT
MSITMKKRVLGFNLIELMFTIAVLAILVGVAVPNVSDTVKLNRVQSQTRELFSQLNYARSEAVSRRHTVLLCHSNDAATCSGTWNSGWIICVDSNQNHTCDNTETVLRVYSDLGTNTLAVVDNAATPVAQDYISFSPNGYASLLTSSPNFTFKVCDSGNNVKYARAILVTGAGQILESRQNPTTRIYKDAKDGDLVCP